MFEIANVEKVIRHLVRFGSTQADAEDLAQETLLIAWRKQTEREPGRELDAWLYGTNFRSGYIGRRDGDPQGPTAVALYGDNGGMKRLPNTQSYPSLSFFQ